MEKNKYDYLFLIGWFDPSGTICYKYQVIPCNFEKADNKPKDFCFQMYFDIPELTDKEKSVLDVRSEDNIDDVLTQKFNLRYMDNLGVLSESQKLKYEYDEEKAQTTKYMIMKVLSIPEKEIYFKGEKILSHDRKIHDKYTELLNRRHHQYRLNDYNIIDLLELVTNHYYINDRKLRFNLYYSNADIFGSYVSYFLMDRMVSKSREDHFCLDLNLPIPAYKGFGYDSAYSIIGNIIQEFMSRHIVGDYIVFISLNGNEMTELYSVDFEEDDCYIWENDWWEGEEDIVLNGFIPFCELSMDDIKR